MIASLKLTLVILGVFAVAIAAATFIEVRYGMDGARALVYDAFWFEALLALLIINLAVSLFANMPYRRFQTGFVITHIAFILVLVSSAITRYFGYEGTMHIREGSSTGHLMSDRDFVQLTAGRDSDSYAVRLYKPGKTDISEKLVVAGTDYDVSVSEYWPRFEMVLENGEGGRPILAYSAHDGESGLLEIGRTFQDQGVTLHFADEPGNVSEVGGSPFGEIVVTFTEFMPNFRVGTAASPDDPMENPAVRVRVADDAGNSEERLLFAYHPNFNMGERTEALSGVGVKYVFGGNIYVFFDESGLAAVASVPMDIIPPARSTSISRMPGGRRSRSRGSARIRIAPPRYGLRYRTRKVTGTRRSSPSGPTAHS